MEAMALTGLILALAAGTFLMRWLPIALLRRFTLPAWVQDWLALVPGAVLAASLAQALLVHDDQLVLTWRNAPLLAAFPTFLIAWRTRNVVLTMLCGMATFVLLTHLGI